MSLSISWNVVLHIHLYSNINAMWSTVAFIQNNCDMPCDVMVINNGVMVLLCYVGWGSVGDTKISHVVIYLHSLW